MGKTKRAARNIVYGVLPIISSLYIKDAVHVSGNFKYVLFTDDTSILYYYTHRKYILNNELNKINT